MTLHRHVQGCQETLRREEIHDDSLLDSDRFCRNAHRLAVQSEVDDEFFRGSRNATKIRVRTDRVAVIDLHLLLCWSLGFVFFFFRMVLSFL